MRRGFLRLFAAWTFGLVLGFALARTGTFVQIVTILAEALVTVLDRHGLEVTLAVAAFGFMGWMVWRCMTWVIEGRDNEIGRLVADKRWWQERFAGVVPSSTAEVDDVSSP